MNSGRRKRTVDSIWWREFDERQQRLILNCMDYADSDPAGLPGHNLMLIIAKMVEVLGCRVEDEDEKRGYAVVPFWEDAAVPEPSAADLQLDPDKPMSVYVKSDYTWYHTDDFGDTDPDWIVVTEPGIIERLEGKLGE